MDCENVLCHECGLVVEHFWNDAGEYVCAECGIITRRGGAMLPSYPTEEDRWNKAQEQWPENPGGAQYKELFHWNERFSQFVGSDPLIPDKDWARIVEAARSGQYGAPRNFSRASVLVLLRGLGLRKYRERWRTILNTVNVRARGPVPDLTAEETKPTFLALVHSFDTWRKTMPNGERERFSFLNYNYILRKIFEMYGDLRFNKHFPLPRSHQKLHALDDIMAKMCLENDFNFSRSAVIKRPKIRTRKQISF